MGRITRRPFGVDHCVELDGSGNTLLQSALPAGGIGVPNAWSAGLWYKPDAGAFAADNQLIDIKSTGAINNILMRLRGDLADEILIQIGNSAGTYFKIYALSAPLTVDTWHFLVMTWDGTDLLLYLDGTERNTTKTTDDPGTQTDTARRLGFGSNPLTGALPSFGRWNAVGLWNSVLTSGEQLTLASGIAATTGEVFQDWTVDHGSYASSASLQHYYKPGFGANIGKDYGVAVSGVLPVLFSGGAYPLIVKDAPVDLV